MRLILFKRILIINLIIIIIASADDKNSKEVEKVTSSKPSTETEPMLMVKTTLNSFRSMYNYYREEFNLGYCWAEYIVDINKLIDTLTGSRINGGIVNDQSDINSSIIQLLKRWFDNNNNNNQGNIEDEELVGVYRDENDFGDKKVGGKYNNSYFVDPRIEEDKFELAEERNAARGISDIFISILGLNVPPGVGPLMLGVGSSPGLIITARIIGTLFRVGKNILETINNNKLLYCTKNYLSVKFYRWLDS